MRKRGLWKKSFAVLTAAVLLAAPSGAESSGQNPESGIHASGSLTLILGEPLEHLLTETSGMDLNWLNQIMVSYRLDTLEEDLELDDATLVVPDDELSLPDQEASARIYLNGTDFVSLHALIEAEEGKVYVLSPELRPEAMLLEMSEIASGSVDDGGLSSEISAEAQDLIASISGEELQEFQNRISEIVSSGITVSSENGSAAVGTITKELTKTSFSISGEQMNQAVTEILQALPADALVGKVLESGLAKTIASAFGIETDEVSLLSFFEELAGRAADLSGEDTPGFRFTVGTDEDGTVREISAVMIQRDVEMELLDCMNLSGDGQSAVSLSCGGGLKALLGLDPEKKTMISVTGPYTEKDGKTIFSGTIDVILEDETIVRIMMAENQMQILSGGKLYLTAVKSGAPFQGSVEIPTESAIPVSSADDLQEYLMNGDLGVLTGRLAELQGNE